LTKDAFALTNIDDRNGNIMLQNTKAEKHSYALKSPADFKAKIISDTVEGLQLDIDDDKQHCDACIGEFNAYNLLAVYSTVESRSG
jgi:UDP-N-acetylmuramoyl-L-alanyl-D-glutamate--2,6-diaminopimelate ligase